jgi:hypothetical protein
MLSGRLLYIYAKPEPVSESGEKKPEMYKIEGGKYQLLSFGRKKYETGKRKRGKWKRKR